MMDVKLRMYFWKTTENASAGVWDQTVAFPISISPHMPHQQAPRPISPPNRLTSFI